MAGAKESEVRAVLVGIRGDIRGEAFPGADDLESPDWPRDAMHVLIATVLSHRTKDANTYLAAKQLFSHFDSVPLLAQADLDDIERLIRPSGFYRVKAKGIKKICQELMVRYDGIVPDTIEELVTLPMVGRKTANCVLTYAFGKDGICVDVHVHRISNRLGWVRTEEPDETEMLLRQKVPRELWCDINKLMVRFGQKTCLPRNPRCSRCPISQYCQYFKEKKS
jgi:endonuclease-3